MLITSFDCYCNGEKVKNIKEMNVHYRGKLQTLPIFRWFSRGNCHLFYAITPEGLKEYYYNKCMKDITLENNTYDKAKNITKEKKNIWIRCKNNERLRKIEGIFYDVYGEEMEIMDTMAFCRFSRNLMIKDMEIPRYVLISDLRIEVFEKKIDEWIYISAIQTFCREANAMIILSLKGCFLKDMDIKEVKEDEIC